MTSTLGIGAGVNAIPHAGGKHEENTGSGLRNPKGDPHFDIGPVWSPNGRTIAFVGHADGMDIFVVNADGRGLRNVTRSPGDDLNPSWSLVQKN